MRLIDCDKLRDELGTEILMEEVDEDITIDDIIANVPTVEAMPIEYLFKELKQCKASTLVEVG